MLEAALTYVQGIADAKREAALARQGKRKTFFNWQSTVDGKTFVSLPSTPLSKTTLADLTPLTTYGFRVSVTGSNGVMGPWSQVVAFLVLTPPLRRRPGTRPGSSARPRDSSVTAPW